MNAPSLRQKAGCWLNERWRMEFVLGFPALARAAGWRWQDLCNRHEHLSACDEAGRICRWESSSTLTACRIFPHLGARLLKHVSRRHPFSLEMQPNCSPVSAIVPVRGTDREPALVFVAAALRAVGGSGSEVLVCEHDVVPRLQRDWPAGIRHVFIPAATGEAFNKSKALNAGALAARHPILLIHDADVWPSSDYITRCAGLMEREGWDAIRPIRFLFMLDEEQARACIAARRVQGVDRVGKVQQNNPGLSSFVRRDTYMDLGGHDERFTGWGWEDMEFLDRLQTRKLYPGAFMPAIHLWHAPPPSRKEKDWNRDRLVEIRQEPVAQRIERARRQLRGG